MPMLPKKRVLDSQVRSDSANTAVSQYKTDRSEGKINGTLQAKKIHLHGLSPRPFPVAWRLAGGGGGG